MESSIFRRLESEARKEGIELFVVGAAIVKGNRVLLVRRRKDDWLGGLFEVPGGKVKTGESIEKALYREVMEETGLKVVRILDSLEHFDYKSRTGKNTRQFNFHVSVKEPVEISLVDHDKYVWARPSKLDRYNITSELKNSLAKIWRKR